MKTTLTIRHDGVRAVATVATEKKAVHLDLIVEAALQSDAYVAAAYAEMMRSFRGRIEGIFRREIDGSRDCGCCWVSVAMRDRQTGNMLTGTHPVGPEYRGWRLPADALDRAMRIAKERGIE